MDSRKLKILHMAYAIFLVHSTTLDSTGGCLNTKADLCSPQNSSVELEKKSGQANYGVFMKRLGLVPYCALGLSGNR